MGSASPTVGQPDLEDRVSWRRWWQHVCVRKPGYAIVIQVTIPSPLSLNFFCAFGHETSVRNLRFMTMASRLLFPCFILEHAICV